MAIKSQPEAGQVLVALKKELEKIRKEKEKILRKYGVSNFRELWKKVENDEIDDTEAHSDIVRLDYLEHREKLIKDLIKRLPNIAETSEGQHLQQK